MNQTFVWIILAVVAVALGIGLFVMGQEPASESSAQSNGKAMTTQTQDVDLEKATEKQILAIVKDPASGQRLEAILAFAKKPPKDLATVIPELSKILLEQSDNPHAAELFKIAAGIALQKIGPSGADHLRGMLESKVDLEIAMGCGALKDLGGAEKFIPQMKTWLESENSNHRRRALFALQGSNQAAIELLPQVAATLKDPDFNVQCMACRVIVNLGPDAVDATEDVLELFKTGNPSARSWAAFALGAIGPNTKLDTSKLLAGNLNAFLQVEKQRTLFGLARMGIEAADVEKDVREAMLDEKRRVMPDAAYALWRITGETEEPLKILGQALQKPEVVEDVLELVGKMESSAAPLVKQIMGMLDLDEESESPTELAIIALGNIGGGAEIAIGSLEKIITDPKADALIRYYAQEAIDKIKATGPK